MVISCGRCDRQLANVASLRRHLQKLKVCDAMHDIDRSVLLKLLDKPKPAAIFTCPSCEKSYTARSNLTRHYKTCSERKKMITITQDELKNTIANLVNEHLKEKNIVQNVTVNGDVNNNTYVNIQFNDIEMYLNCEEAALSKFISHIHKEKFIKYIQGDPKEEFPQLFKKVFFNSKCPENLTFAVIDPESDNAAILCDEGWCQKSAKLTTIDLLSTLSSSIVDENSKLESPHKRPNNDIYKWGSIAMQDDFQNEMVKLAHNNLSVVEAIHGPIAPQLDK